MRDFRRLNVWQKAHRLALATYAASATLAEQREFDFAPADGPGSRFGSRQPGGGCGRKGDPELRRFCLFALGSASELEYHFLLARDLGFLGLPAYEPLAGQVVEVKKMLTGFIAQLTAES